MYTIVKQALTILALLLRIISFSLPCCAAKENYVFRGIHMHLPSQQLVFNIILLTREYRLRIHTCVTPGTGSYHRQGEWPGVPPYLRY